MRAKTLSLLSLALANSLFAANIPNQLPAVTTLSDGENRVDVAIGYKQSQNYTFGNTTSASQGTSFSISTADANNKGTYTLTLQDPAGTPPPNVFTNFYVGVVNITNTDVNFVNFDEFTFGNKVTLTNSSLNLQMGNRRNKIIGLNNGNAKIELINSSFSTDAATFQLDTEGAEFRATGSTINMPNTNVSNSGTIILTNTDITMNSITNVGKKVAQIGYDPSTSTFINNGGSVTINGNFNNGGLRDPSINQSICAAMGECGGGVLQNLNGGNITIKGDLISKEDANLPSKIDLQGGTLKVEGRVENQAGSTISVGSHNGVVGKIEADEFSNTNTASNAISIDLQGVSNQNVSSVIQAANISGVDKNTLTFQNNNTGLSEDELISKVQDNTSTTPPSGGGINPPGGGTTPPGGGTTTPPTGGDTNPPGGTTTPPSGGDTSGNPGGGSNPGDSGSNSGDSTNPGGSGTNPGGSTTPPSSGDSTNPGGGSGDQGGSGGSTGGSGSTTPPSTQPSLASRYEAIDNAYADFLNKRNNANISGGGISSNGSGFSKAQANAIVNDTQSSLGANYISTSLANIDAMKLNNIFAPSFASFSGASNYAQKLSRIKLASINNFDLIQILSSIKEQRDYGVTFSGVRAEGNDIGNTNFGVLELFHSGTLNNSSYKLSLSYGYGWGNHDLSTQAVDNKMHIVQGGAQARIFFDTPLELDLASFLSFGHFSTDRTTQIVGFDPISTKGNFNTYSLELDSSLGYRFDMQNLAIKPFLGLTHTLNHQGAISESGGLNVSASSYNAYLLNLLAGVEGRVFVDESEFFARIFYERNLINTHDKVRLSLGAQRLEFDYPFDDKIGLVLGGEFALSNALRFGIEGFYRSTFESARYYGGSLRLRYVF